MKKFIVLFREPDGRTVRHFGAEVKLHRAHWQNWFSVGEEKGYLGEGSGLTLNGRVIRGNGNTIINGIYKTGKEIIGGFLLFSAVDLDEAAEIISTCPIFEFGGIAEIRELQNQ